MDNRKFIGMLTPSSNTVLEPITNKILNSIEGVTSHFSRFTVTEISSNPNSLNQFNYSKIIESAKLLADAKVNVIAWNGTSASWLGFDTDENLCKEIKKATGINATTTVLTLNEIFKMNSVKNFGLVTPYLEDIQNLAGKYINDVEFADTFTNKLKDEQPASRWPVHDVHPHKSPTAPL